MVKKYLRRGSAVLGLIIVSLLLSPFCLKASETDIWEKAPELFRAKVLTVTNFNNQSKVNQVLEIMIIEGEHRSERIKVSYYPYGNQNILSLKEGDEVFVRLETDVQGGLKGAYVAEIARDKYLLYLFTGFLGLLIFIGGIKGFKAVISLGLTYLAVILILLPMILKGYDPIAVTVIISTGLTIVTLVINSGINRKTFAAIIGTTVGLATAALITIYIGEMTKLTGLGHEDSYLLQYIPQDVDFSLRGLLFAGIIMGALGAVMDVGMSIASAINEIQEKMSEIKTWELIKAGMNVGRDIMGTMANTLILAYAGGSINLLLLIVAEGGNLMTLVNQESIAAVRALAGSIGLILTVPVTAVIAGLIRKKHDFSQ